MMGKGKGKLIIKINYNFIAFLLAVLLVGSFCVIEFILPQDKLVMTEETEQTVTLPVVMYHHLSVTSSRLGDYVISPEQFEEDLKYIQKCGYTTISAAELLDFLKEGKILPQKPIMITFDDGYESVHEYAFPLLKKYNMKAIIAIIGKHTDIFSKEEQPKHINYSHVSWGQLREMQESGVFEIANHSYDMHDNQSGKRKGIRKMEGESDTEYSEAIYEDVGGLSREIEKELGITPNIFAYPFGAICSESKTILEELEFEIILTCEEKPNHLFSHSDLPVPLRRYNRAHKYSTYDFFKKIGVEPT